MVPRNARGQGALAVLALPLLCHDAAVAQDDAELQKKLSNPVSDLVTLPFQWTTTLNAGPLDKPQHTLNIQPVYPFKLSDRWSLINRVIVPVLSSPALVPDQDRKNGLGDVLYQGFFAPSPTPGGLIWGIGPAVMMRTATDDRLGTGKWSTGPTAVILAEPGNWTLGAVVTQLWSFAGDGDRRDVNFFQFQPVVSYRLNPSHSIGYVGIITADWKEDRSSQRWTVPLGASLSIVTKPPGFVPVNYIVGGGYNVIRPDTTGNWFFRFQVNFILPK